MIGSQASVQAEWQVERHTTLTAVYSHFLAGPFLREPAQVTLRVRGIDIKQIKILEFGRNDPPFSIRITILVREHPMLGRLHVERLNLLLGVGEGILYAHLAALDGLHSRGRCVPEELWRF